MAKYKATERETRQGLFVVVDISDIERNTKTNDKESERERKATEKLMKKAEYIKSFLKETREEKKYSQM